MHYILVFFREEVSRVVRSGAVIKSDFAKSDGVTDGIFANVVVTKTFRGRGPGPVNAPLVIVEHRGRNDSIMEREVRRNVADLEDLLGAFVSAYDFRFTRAATGAFLTFGGPRKGPPRAKDNVTPQGTGGNEADGD